jgi:hypothetical protein
VLLFSFAVLGGVRFDDAVLGEREHLAETLHVLQQARCEGGAQKLGGPGKLIAHLGRAVECDRLPLAEISDSPG